ncbi:MAG: radical SAM protein [Bacteroidales bacterium]|nr:radical SAM protein [Bacteroidales bacterium]
MTVAEIFEARKDDPRLNTSYPPDPQDWAPYRVPGPLPFEPDGHLSFYIHIPFCRQLCSFCEYTRMICPDEHKQQRYLRAVSRDIEAFREEHPSITILGFDIGGGTPTSLSESSFSMLMDVYRQAVEGVSLGAGYEPGIEGSFSTLSMPKLEAIARAGISRLSLGVQSSDCNILHRHGRGMQSEAEMAGWLDAIYSAGISKVNLDFMYGLKGQNPSTIAGDLELISRLHPRQVTLYEVRGNMVKELFCQSKPELFSQYSQYFDGLTGMGYKAHFGQNTFSTDPSDLGLSSYLRTRMTGGASYKGFGLSAQSMSRCGLSYNVGKLAGRPETLINSDTYPEQDTYILPPREMAAKYLAISGYFGEFSKGIIASLGADDMFFRERLDFCLAQGLLEEHGNDRIRITRKGFLHYGAVFSLLCG